MYLHVDLLKLVPICFLSYKALSTARVVSLATREIPSYDNPDHSPSPNHIGGFPVIHYTKRYDICLLQWKIIIMTIDMNRQCTTYTVVVIG